MKRAIEQEGDTKRPRLQIKHAHGCERDAEHTKGGSAIYHDWCFRRVFCCACRTPLGVRRLRDDAPGLLYFCGRRHSRSRIMVSGHWVVPVDWLNGELRKAGAAWLRLNVLRDKLPLPALQLIGKYLGIKYVE